MIVARCHVFQAEMLTWAQDRGKRPMEFDGTVKSLVSLFERHPDSTYHDLEPDSRETYSRTLKGLVKLKGDRRIAEVTGNDVRRWYKETIESGRAVNTAYYLINVFKSALAFGSSLRLQECRILRQELRDTRFSTGKRSTEQLTYEQVVKLRDKARELGLFYIARTVVLQFDFAMRRRDIIGKWYSAPLDTDGIRNGKHIWRDGLTWADIDADGVVRRVVSKTRKKTAAVAVHAIGDYPNVAEELARTPNERRIGPLVLHDRTGLPPTEPQCRRDYRKVADACGISLKVKMMHARAGGTTEAYESGATEEEAMALATHSEAATNRLYLRELEEQSHRAAVKRVASRAK